MIFQVSHLLPVVSGKLRARSPARVVNIPMVNTGAGSQYIFSKSSSIVVIPPILAMRAHSPTA